MCILYKSFGGKINFIFLNNLTAKPCGKFGRPSVAVDFKVLVVKVINGF